MKSTQQQTDTENIKPVGIRESDYQNARSIKAERSLPYVEILGCALDAFKELPRKKQDEIIRRRAQRRMNEPAHPAAVA